MQNLVLLPDANELPDANTLGTGILRLTLAEQDCRSRMHDDNPSARVYKRQNVHMPRSQNTFVRAQLSELLFRDKASQPC